MSYMQTYTVCDTEIWYKRISLKRETNEGYELSPGEFLVESPRTGGRVVLVPTGRTRQFNVFRNGRSVSLPFETYTRHTIETFGRDGVIYGRKGARITGTAVSSPN
jgi:hypothetical protein